MKFIGMLNRIWASKKYKNYLCPFKLEGYSGHKKLIVQVKVPIDFQLPETMTFEFTFRPEQEDLS